VLPIELVWLNKWVFLRNPQIVRDCSFNFPYLVIQFARLLGLPRPYLFVWPFAGNCGGELAEFLLIQLRPEFRQRHGAVESDVQRYEEWVVVAFHEGECVRNFCGWPRLMTPKRAAVGK